jgi:hypothetical protein
MALAIDLAEPRIPSAQVEMHRGSIRACSEGPGQGAKFVIELETTNTA